MKLKKPSKKFVVDTTSRVLYSIVVGTGIDYFYGGIHSFLGILGSRSSATGINSLTSGIYGLWQDQWYLWLKTVPEKRKLKLTYVDKKINLSLDDKNISYYFKKNNFSELTGFAKRRGKQFITDMLTFNTFEPFVYCVANCIGQLVDSGDIDFSQTYEGMKTVVYLSPFIAPTMRLTINSARKILGIKSSSEIVNDSLENVVN